MHFLWEILQECLQEILWEIFKICKSSVGNSVENVAGNAAGNGFWNDTVFSLNTWLRMMYCLQTIHKPACVILTLFQFLFYSRNIHINILVEAEPEKWRYVCLAFSGSTIGKL